MKNLIPCFTLLNLCSQSAFFNKNIFWILDTFAKKTKTTESPQSGDKFRTMLHIYDGVF